ncbi:MAG: hypothetical protein H6538_00665 [Bacteroidales bacterium]|nr:hypothetical protein [Bacteroidales bacterium]MCB8998577.1 hypothetical protein [Bacteroidales bacterium]MCB9012555.1 hypothetical protein [Bacteroidales bacterium]
MKKSFLHKPLIILLSVLFIANACKKDESYTQVSEFERGIHNALNDYRASLGKDPMVLQFLLMNDAKTFSAKMANETEAFSTDWFMPELENQKVLLAADSSAAWVAYCEYEEPDSVMSIVLNNPDIRTKIEGYFNQNAVGTAKDINGNYYITGLMLHFKK